MITRIEATRYRCFDKLDVDLGEFRVLVGVRREIEQRLADNGWHGRAAAVVIEPELEVLLWQDNVNVERALRHQGGSLRQLLAQDGRWPASVAKPPAPKELIQGLIRTNRAGVPVAVYGKIASAVSTAGCADPAFHRIRDALRAWFPAEGA